MNLFVYGTLKTGFSNHYLLKEATYLGHAKTPPTYDLFPFHPAADFPICVEGGNVHVLGELYQINEQVLADCDQLEGHPKWYRRKLIQLHDGPLAYIYIFAQDYEPSMNGIVHIPPCKFWIGKGREYDEDRPNYQF